MSVTNAVRMAGAKKGLNDKKIAEGLHMSKQSFSNKVSRGFWTAADLLAVAEITGGRLIFDYPDGQQILINMDDEKPVEKE